MMPALLTGMAVEARLARRTGLPVACAGADAEAAAEALLDAGTVGIVSFGVAGGLAPDLRPGTLVLATAVVGDGVSYGTDPVWRSRLAGAFPQARSGAVAGATRPVVAVSEKTDLHTRTGALAVDMESLAVARVCHRRGRPFAVLRAVADPAGRALPPLALSGLDGQGRIAPAAVLARLAGEPRQVAGLCRLGLDFGWALLALHAAAGAFPGGVLGLDPVERVGDVA
ncbi:nucleoside phosphorylase [Azospirillum soli]|uniref:phosphorylase family protein n=1 Tax=Azospirillum soli TaxID=1304799 RepID=UPI001AEB5C52|nr:nucleoside phosphorylase [Azospirillum soli]MBP2314816.1 hopanoid-associated phosphorylase [Azospirillum soli]